MEYTINKLAKLAGVSTRTLRYYDELGLLSPVQLSSNGYRIYGQNEVNRSQQIKKILFSKDFDWQEVLESRLTALLGKRKQLDLLIANVEKTMKAEKGEIIMSDQEKFKGFCQKLVDDNERQYGEEIRGKYGDDVVDRSNAKIKGMTKEQYDQVEKLSAEVNKTLKAAFEQGDPSSELAQKACDLHKRWLCFYWDNYSKEAHIGITQMYVEDPRFTAYYDKIMVGCTSFLRDAVLIYCK